MRRIKQLVYLTGNLGLAQLIVMAGLQARAAWLLPAPDCWIAAAVMLGMFLFPYLLRNWLIDHVDGVTKAINISFWGLLISSFTWIRSVRFDLESALLIWGYVSFHAGVYFWTFSDPRLHSLDDLVKLRELQRSRIEQEQELEQRRVFEQAVEKSRQRQRPAHRDSDDDYDRPPY